MCDIFGTPWELKAILDVLFTGLKRLEYRRYDSAGLCVDTTEAPHHVSYDGMGRPLASPLASANSMPDQAVDVVMSGYGSLWVAAQ